MVLDKDGDVMEDINLPEIARQPDKAQIISCRKAVAIARERGFNTEGVRVSFDYSSARKAFVWIVTKPRPDIVPLIGKGSYEKLEIDANTGAVFNTQIETIII